MTIESIMKLYGNGSVILMDTEHLSKRELRRQLWEQDPHCYWCGIETKWDAKKGKALTPDCATLDHLYTRYEMSKRKQYGNPFVLACNQCNHDLGAKATKAQPIEELWRRAGQWERMILEGRLTNSFEPVTLSDCEEEVQG